MKRLLTLCLFALTSAAWAGLPAIDFNNLSAPTNDLQAALYLAFEVWAPPPADANHLVAKAGITPDGFQVAAFLSSKSGWTLSAIWSLREKGMEWSDIAARCKVPWDAVVVQPGRDYGPPYGKAWGYWKKHGEDRHFRLSDREFVEMIRVHTLSRATGLSADQVMEGLLGGKDYQRWAGEVYREKHGKGHEHGDSEGQGEHGHGQDKEHGHDKKK